MTTPRIVSREDWLKARTNLLRQEKEFSRARDALTAERGQMPWTKVTKPYVFETPTGPASLATLFGPRGQLIVYHFMFHPDWSEGCKSCSLVADHYNPAVVHLNQRDVSLVTVSRAPLNKLLAFKARMGWTFPWVSSFGNEFNRDFNVSFTEAELERAETTYNYKVQKFPMPEAPGISVFAKSAEGEVFHTYSAYARGLENFMGVYSLLDLVPKGRDEAGLGYVMQWVRHHDRYGGGDPHAALAATRA
ncbi:MAG: thioredoxin family protein [Rhodospirillaceae bacterium]|nr:thioredoxin family protein [Rhodospirillaceae bacterium]